MEENKMAENDSKMVDYLTPEDMDTKCADIKIEAPMLHYGLDTLAAAAAVNDAPQITLNSNNKHTNRKTGADMKIFFNYLSSVGEARQPQDIPESQLDKLLCSFFMDVRKTDKTEYEPCSLRSMLASIERYLKINNYPSSLTKDSAFAKTRYTLKVKQKLLRDMGKGSKSQHTFNIGSLKDKSLDKAFEAREMGPYTPSSVLQTLCFVFVVYLRLRKATEHKKLLWGDVILDRDQNGREYITFSDQMLRRCTLQYLKQCQPVVYALPDAPDRDPVRIYKLYASKRAMNMNYPYAPFYLGMNVYNPNELQLWYKTIAMGINKLNEMVRVVRDLTGPTSMVSFYDDSLDSPQDLSLPALKKKNSQRQNVSSKPSMVTFPENHNIKTEHTMEVIDNVSPFLDSFESKESKLKLDVSEGDKKYVKVEEERETGIDSDKAGFSDDASDEDEDIDDGLDEFASSFDEEEEEDVLNEGNACEIEKRDEFINLPEAKKQFEMLVNRLRGEDVSTFNSWINNIDVVKDTDQDKYICKEKSPKDPPNMTSETVDNTDHHITLNITLSSKAFRGEAPVVVTASSQPLDPPSTVPSATDGVKHSTPQVISPGQSNHSQSLTNPITQNSGSHRRKRNHPTKQTSSNKIMRTSFSMPDAKDRNKDNL